VSVCQKMPQQFFCFSSHPSRSGETVMERTQNLIKGPKMGQLSHSKQYSAIVCSDQWNQ